MDKEKIIDFYDNFVPDQADIGINDRIFSLYKRFLYLGLNSRSTVLELGCGIGSLTYLLSRTVNKGKIEAVDISPGSIEFAKKRIQKPNVSFSAADIVNYKPSTQSFDFITLFDVIEHIPLEKHPELFQSLSTICSDHTKILINIPNSESLEFHMTHKPETLQIIDQQVPLTFILKNLENNELTLSFFETYSIWIEKDYQFFVIEKKKPFKEVKLSDKRSLIQKALKKAERIFIQWRYNYK